MSPKSSSFFGIVSKFLSTIIALAAIGGFLAWMGGAFHKKVPPGETPIKQPSAEGRKLVTVTRVSAEESLDVVATVQPRRQVDVASQVLATIREVYVDPGARIKIGDDLILLDDNELLAQQREALAALSVAETELALRKRDLKRYTELLPKGTVTREDFDRVQSATVTAEAQVNRSRQQVNRIEVQLGYTKIKATSPGIVADRFVEKGDLAVPGKPLLKLQDTREFELHANVPESQSLSIAVGQKLPFRIESANLQAQGTVREIVPLAQEASRSVLIKVTIPSDQSAPIYAGMFGRVALPMGKSDRIVIPIDAVQSIGQLEMVEVEYDGKLGRRFIRTGRRFDPKDVEILSGLIPGERVALPYRGSHDTK